MNEKCTCSANSEKLHNAAAEMRVAGKGWSWEIIMMLMRQTSSTFPPTIRKGAYAINMRCLAGMLGNRYDRSLIARELAEATEESIASIGFCSTCKKPLPPPKKPRETYEQQRERYAHEIAETLERHPEVKHAQVTVWKDNPGQGLAINNDTPKHVFKAKLTLIDGTLYLLDRKHPERRPNKALPPTIFEYKNRNGLWNIIKNRKFFESPADYDATCFPEEKHKRAYEQQVRRLYSTTRNISSACLQVRLLTTRDLAPGNLPDFRRICSTPQRYYCEVITRAPGAGNTQGPILHLEHVSLRSLQETGKSSTCTQRLLNRFIKMQQRFIQPLSDFEWWLREDGGGKLRRMVGYRVGAGVRNTIYAQTMRKIPRALAQGKRYFGEVDNGTRYLTLVEICDQQTGVLELKWCLTTDHCKAEEGGALLSHDQNNLYSVIKRYRGEAGTARQVKTGKKWYYQVQRILAYCHGESTVMQKLDTTLKQLTRSYQCIHMGAKGILTEFRSLDGLDDCLAHFRVEAARVGLDCVEPKSAPIDWNLLIGPESVTLEEWFKEACTGQAA